jgi:hypothetical protein
MVSPRFPEWTSAPARPDRRTWMQGAGASLCGLFGTAANAEVARANALVIGNAGYRGGALRNPANDARAMGEALGALGCEVQLLIDADGPALRRAMAAYADSLGRRRSPGVFYYAGHGLQQAWRNYLVPVDAEITSATDVERQTVPLNALLDALARAGNAPNLIILDACRDFPFGPGSAGDARGLSQIDAPPGTLIAYATAPGRTASDGTGDHGLYTGALLGELKSPGSSVEDVFKRVRLAVRLASKGAQVPWESTSLESDFQFGGAAPPAPDEAARNRSFAEQLTLWESIKGAGRPAPFEAYLRQFPSGYFSELAQLQLDRLLAGAGERPVRAAPQAGNPHTAGTVRSDTAFRPGDSYRYIITDLSTGQETRRLTQRVTAIGEREVEFNGGGFVTDLLGNPRRWGDGRRSTDYQMLPTEFAVGRRWVTRFRVEHSQGRQIDSEYEFRIVRRETVQVPAGRFDAYRCEGLGISRGQRGGMNATLAHTYWMVPELCRRPVKSETRRVRHQARQEDRVIENDRWELDFFQQGRDVRPTAAAGQGEQR